MRPYGASSSHKSDSNRKYGVADLTNLTNLTVMENENDEGIVTDPTQKVAAFTAKERDSP
jgi:hypothetical protein